MNNSIPYIISVVIPVYKAEAVLPALIERLEQALTKMQVPYEIILVDDGSPDRSWELIINQGKLHRHIKGVKLSRNFGQHNAIAAGLDLATGEWIIVMDCDLQDQPEEILKLYKEAISGYKIVLARREFRKDNYFKVLSSKIFYAIFSYLTDVPQDSTIANFGIYHRDVISAIKKMGDYFRVFPILVQWVGFSRSYINVDHAKREAGTSSYTFRKLTRLALDMIVSFSEKPLKLVLKMGMIISLLSFFLGLMYLINYLMGEILVPGFTSIVILITFHLGILLSFLGVIGLYVGKISIQIKDRPIFLIEEQIN